MTVKKAHLSKIVILIGVVVLFYLLVSLYFTRHFFFRTVINGVKLGGKSYGEAEQLIKNYLENYELQIIGRDGLTDTIKGSEIGLQYNDKNSIPKIYHLQKAFLWISPLLIDECYYVSDLYRYDENQLHRIIDKLAVINKGIVEPRNVYFKYFQGTYIEVEEIYGNTIIKERVINEIINCILKGNQRLVLDKKNCYLNPKYTLKSRKTESTKKLLNKYVTTKIIYQFGDQTEILDANTIHKWLKVDDNLDVMINEPAVINYIKNLSRKYDTVGVSRTFKTSTGKTVEVTGGLYGWQINQEEEKDTLVENIKTGKVIEREPIYSQRARIRGEDDIGDTYVEINITRQHLWYYKDGELIAAGPVVTGNPNRGYGTVTGTYMLNYKQKDAILVGPGYEADVTYWMPFFGSIGIHDASWRSSFGGEIYKTRGSHGCVNAPLHLARKIFENIEAGVPIICYEE